MNRNSETTTQINAAIIGAMDAIGYIAKDGNNKAQGFKFLSDEAITISVHRACIANGLTILPIKSSVTERTITETGAGKYRTAIVMHIVWRLTHVSGEWIEVESHGEGVDNGDKSLSKAQTMCRKYMMRLVFCIATGEQDPDAVNGYDDGAPQHAPAQRAQTPAPAPPDPSRTLNAATVANVMRRLEASADSALFAASRDSIEARLLASTEAVIQPLRAAVESCAAGQLDGAALVARVSEILSA
jgi:hypothetical protein